MASDVDILIKATDKASKDIDKVNRSLGVTTKESGYLKRAFGDLKTAVPGLGNAFAVLSNPITIATAGIGALAKISTDSIKVTVAYNKEIRELTQTLGLSAEETSRVVQVADDWGISIEQVHSALALMNKNGVTPSIENLAALADEYVNTTDKAAFAEKAAALLGRQYETLIPLFVGGGDALREQAAAIDDSLIATNASIQASRDYELALDTLGDAVEGLKYQIGNGLIPVLTQAAETMGLLLNWNKSIDAMLVENNQNLVINTRNYHNYLMERTEGLVIAGRMEESLRNELLALSMNRDQLAAMEEVYGDLTEAKISDLALTGQITTETATYLLTLVDAEERLAAATQGTELYNEALYNAIRATNEYGTSEARFVDDLEALPPVIEEVISEEDALAAAQARVNQAMSDLNMIINGQLGPSIEDFNTGQADLQTEMLGVQTRIDEIIAAGDRWIVNAETGATTRRGLTRAEKDELAELQDEYGGLEQQYRDNATEHENATKRILFGMLQQRAALDGLSEAEFIVLNQIAVDWGLVDQATADAALGFDHALGLLNPDGTGVAQALAGVRIIRDEVLGLSGTYGIHFNISTSGNMPSVGGGGGTPIAYAEGTNGWETVPQGFENDTYPIALSSGEKYAVIPKGQAGNTINNNFSMNVHTNAGASTLARDFAMMQALAG